MGCMFWHRLRRKLFRVKTAHGPKNLPFTATFDKHLHELRIARHRLKNEYMAAKTVRDLFTGSLISDIQRALSCLYGLKSLAYTPRVLWPGEYETASFGLPQKTEKTLEE